MEPPAAGVFHGRFERWVVEEFSVGDLFVDARDVHLNDAAGAALFLALTLDVPFWGFMGLRFVEGGAHIFALSLLLLCATGVASAAGTAPGDVPTAFPPPLQSYGDAAMASVWDILRNRVEKQPFNLWATIIFFCAIISHDPCRVWSQPE